MQMKKRILVLDDESLVARTTARVLGPEFEVAVFRDGRKALQEIKRARYDAIVCDVDMGTMTGGDFYRQVRDHSPTLAKHFMFYTATPDPSLTEVPSLLKSGDADKLRSMVQSLV